MKKLLSCFVAALLALALAATALAETAKTFQIVAPKDTLFADETLQLGVEDASGELDLSGVRYTLSNKNATIDEAGLLTPQRSGSVTVTAQTADKKHRATKKITILTRPESITIKGSRETLTIGKKLTLTTTMLPKAVTKKSVTWSSSDEAVAAVSEKGVVTAKAVGTATLTATSVLDPNVSQSVTIQVIRLATHIAFRAKEPAVEVGENLRLLVDFEPADTSVQSLEFSSNRPKTLTVDEAGVVTGVKAGKATVKAKALDGSGKTATIVVNVIQPVQGVHMARDAVRIGVGGYATIEAVLEPKDATDKRMTWTSEDEGIATVAGETNKPRVRAHAWGDTTVTGVTADGGYTVSLVVHGGSYAHAVKIRESRVKANGRISLVFENVSNLDLAQVRFEMRLSKPGGDMPGLIQPIEVSGKYDSGLLPGERTVHGEFTFDHPNIDGDWICETAITGFTTDDGEKFNLKEEKWKFVSTD